MNGYLLTKLGFAVKPLLLFEYFPELLNYGKHNLRLSDFVGSVVLVHPYGLEQEPVQFFSVVIAVDSTHPC